jgi:periplasmic divalent cation tolerance protein
MPANFSIITRGRLAQVQANDKPILIYATFPSVQDAERIGAELVDCRLAACVNIIPA